MNEKSPSLANAKKKRRTSAPNQRAAAAAAAAAIRAMQDFGPHPMMSEKKENFVPRSIPSFANDNNLVASNPFDDPPQRSIDVPTGPPQLPPQFIANPTPRRGINPDQIGNMNYMGMRRMQQSNQTMAMNPMAPAPNRFDHPSRFNHPNRFDYSNRFDNPPMGAVNHMSNMPSNNMPLGQIGNVNNTGMVDNMNQHHHHHHHGHMMNTQMGGPSMNGGGVITGPTLNNSGVGGLSMNGSTMLSPMNGLISDSRVSPANQMMGSRVSPANQMIGSRASPVNPMMGNRASPVNPMMGNRASPVNPMMGNCASPVNPVMNIPVLSPLMSPDHMNSVLNIPPINPMNDTHSQQHFNQMNNRGPMQRPNMPMQGMNPAMLDSNQQMNNMHMARPYNCSPDMNMMNENSYMELNMQNSMIGKPSGMNMNMLQADLAMDSKAMGMPGSDKVFPPNQPMVFNQQNPQAPPISPCGICRREVKATDQAVFCESGCNFWFHRRCTGLTEPAYEMLMREPFAEWVCDKCVTSKDIPLVKYKF